jgi:hypothetical protein
MPSDQCGCGRPSTHAGFCSARRARAPAPDRLGAGLRAVRELHSAAIRFETWHTRWTARGRPTSELEVPPDEDDE